MSYQGPQYGPGPDPYQSNPYTQPPAFGSPEPSPWGYPAAPGGYGGFVDPMAPFGRDPRTGEPYSDKSKVAAGLLQIFLGGFGAGRFYIGDNFTALLQLGLNFGGIVLIFFGAILSFLIIPVLFVLVGLAMTLGVGIWVLVDGIMMLTGGVRDKNGLPLRS